MPLKCNNSDLKYLEKLNAISADVWNNCVKLDKKYYKENKKSMTLSMLEFANKQKFLMHAKGINHIVLKYVSARDAMWRSKKAEHKERKKVKLPYRIKRFMPTGWDSQAVHPEYDNNRIRLTVIKGMPQVICYVKRIPKNIAEIELVYKGKYYLAIKYKQENNNILIQSDNVASIDLGEIHAITSIDNNGHALIITNRKMKSLIRLKEKHQDLLKLKQEKCTKESLQHKKYENAIYKIKYNFNRRILDALHKQTKLYVDWCIKNNIQIVYYGNVDTVTRKAKGKNNKLLNRKLNLWRFGMIIEILESKLKTYGIKMIKVSEAYSSQTCPQCKKRHKTIGRNYQCQCGYMQHRDIVGAINILNFNTNNNLTRYISKEYLQIT